MKKAFIALLSAGILSGTCARNHVDLPGPAINLGFGTFYGGGTIGGELEYQIRKPLGFITITPFVGSGMALSLRRWLPGVGLGCLFEYGTAQRIFGGLMYGTLGEEHKLPDLSANTDTARSMAVGLAGLLGYRGMLQCGFTWNAGISFGIVDQSTVYTKEKTKLGVSLGIGYKY